jgi:hypothetical protein
MKYRLTALLASTAAVVAMAGAACADAPAAPATWWSTIKLGGHLDAGITVNTQEPSSGVNFGRSYDDRANQTVLNSFALTLERDVDTSAKTPDFGFKVQAAYGTDSRYTQLIGEFNRMTGTRETFDIVEGHVDAHLPFLTAGGMEVHAGIMPTLEGIEVIDPTGNFFYSHSYLYNFGIPAKYTGIMTETHINPMVDLYLGYDTGVNTFVGGGGGANDNQFHFHGGIGLNFKTVSVLATTQIGPEDFVSGSPNPFHPIAVHKNRYLSDVAITWHISDKLTSMTDLNYAYDDGYKASAYGAVEYLTYTINPIVSIGGRAEVWKDANNFFVANFQGASDFVNFEGGYAPLKAFPLFAYSPSETYGEFTIGLNVKPMGLPPKLAGLTFRPEIRYDTVLDGGSAFNAQPGIFGIFFPTSKNQVTFAVDVVAPFSVF